MPVTMIQNFFSKIPEQPDKTIVDMIVMLFIVWPCDESALRKLILP